MELANRSGLGIATIQRYERGEVGSVRTIKLEQLAQALEVPFAHLDMIYKRSLQDYEKEQSESPTPRGQELTGDEQFQLFLALSEIIKVYVDHDEISDTYACKTFLAAANGLVKEMRLLHDPEGLRLPVLLRG